MNKFRDFKSLKRNNRETYFCGFLVLLLIEILIAIFIKDDFIRPYLGDFLVVILLYCFLMSISQISVFKGLLIVLIFSLAIEFLQLLNIEKIFQPQPPQAIMIILGSSFSGWDLMAYLLGLLGCLILEYNRNRT
ncbi:uncharacterized protein DUF2809 [Salegentibacter sp. 24]|uniref:ribosomal maturation YjgA family protein n=1 Tax=Salegentibacter sp. 24 TaxID=2183986 RepID=UPI00106009D8|nr:DUF2809 domain-containing protein [Salegentibacter sp. 24]TDN84752.1 uncharacterized protein DUF2809 [Salegentibacter sp. 24]